MERRNDITPVPVTVATREWGDVTPVAVARQVQGTRGKLKKIPLLTVSLVAGLGAIIRPDLMAGDKLNELYQKEEAAAIKELSATPDSKALQLAQTAAVGELFGLEEGRYKMEEAGELTRGAVARAFVNDWRLPAAEFVDSSIAKISKDGKSAEIDGQPYSFATMSKGGAVYVIAAKVLEEKNLIANDHWHMVDPMLVGGAKADERSDLNKDGDVTKEEVKKSAIESAKGNIDWAMQPLRRVVING